MSCYIGYDVVGWDDRGIKRSFRIIGMEDQADVEVG